MAMKVKNLGSRRSRIVSEEGGEGTEGPYTLATLRYCSNKLRGRNVTRVYFEVMTWLELYWCSLRTLCFLL